MWNIVNDFLPLGSGLRGNSNLLSYYNVFFDTKCFCNGIYACVIIKICFSAFYKTYARLS